jgi:hypothetical protein
MRTLGLTDSSAQDSVCDGSIVPDVWPTRFNTRDANGIFVAQGKRTNSPSFARVPDSYQPLHSIFSYAITDDWPVGS